MEGDLMTCRLWTLKPPKYICLWVAISRKSRPYRISYLQPTARTGFWATAERAHKKAFRAMAEMGFISLKLKEHNFRPESHPQTTSPASVSPARIDHHL